MSDEPRDDVPMTIGEHLEELRSHVLKAVLWVLLALVVCLVFQGRIFGFILGPHDKMVESIQRDNKARDALARLASARVDAALAAIKRDDEVGKKLEEAERAQRIARELATPTSSDALADLKRRQDEAVARLEALTRDLRAAADQKPVDAAKLAALEKDLEAAREQVAALRAEVARDVRPLIDVDAKGPKQELLSVDPTDTFVTHIKLSLVAALFIAAPLILWELWKFISRALFAHEKKWVGLFGPMSYVAFLTGFMFGYFVLIPLGLSFLAAYAPVDIVETSYSVKGYISMVITLSLVCGVIFELPLFMCFLALIGIVDAPTLREYRKFWVLAAFIIGGILTPPDPFTQTLMAVPLLGLYEVGILLAAMVGPKAAPPPPEVVAEAAPAPEPTLAEKYPETPIPEYPPVVMDPPVPVPDAQPLDPLAPRPAPEGTVPVGAPDEPPPTSTNQPQEPTA